MLKKSMVCFREYIGSLLVISAIEVLIRCYYIPLYYLNTASRVRVSLATVIMISSLLRDSSDGFVALPVPMICGITNKVMVLTERNLVFLNIFYFWNKILKKKELST